MMDVAVEGSDVVGNTRSLRTSVKRAREPYDAIEAVSVSHLYCSGLDVVPRLSAAITTPSLNLTPRTDVPVTAGDCV